MKIILFFSTCAVALSSPFSMPKDASDYSVDFNGSDKLISLKVTDEGTLYFLSYICIVFLSIVRQ